MPVRIKVNEGAIVQRDAATYTAGEELDVPTDEAKQLVADGAATKVETK